jgi:cold shock CspA family protein
MADRTVSWIRSTKRFGYFVPDDGSSDVLVRFSRIEDSHQELLVCQRVTFSSET